MAWIMDTYSMTAGQMTTGVVTGKPVSLGGSLGRSSATGRGVFLTGARAAKAINLPLEGARIAVQGFGNVGAASARFFHAAGGKIVGIQDMAGTLLNETGIDPDGLSRHLASGGSMTTFDGAELVAKDDFWSLASDILVPAALENQITSERARKLRTRLIVEGANGPTTSEAQDILTERGVTVVPDVLANSGGVIVSYFEWVQDFSSFFWNESEIDQRLRSIIEPAFDATWELAETSKLPLRSAAYLLACKRILQARSERGLYP